MPCVQFIHQSLLFFIYCPQYIYTHPSPEPSFTDNPIVVVVVGAFVIRNQSSREINRCTTYTHQYPHVTAYITQPAAYMYLKKVCLCRTSHHQCFVSNDNSLARSHTHIWHVPLVMCVSFASLYAEWRVPTITNIFTYMCMSLGSRSSTNRQHIRIIYTQRSSSVRMRNEQGAAAQRKTNDIKRIFHAFILHILWNICREHTESGHLYVYTTDI